MIPIMAATIVTRKGISSKGDKVKIACFVRDTDGNLVRCWTCSLSFDVFVGHQ